MSCSNNLNALATIERVTRDPEIYQEYYKLKTIYKTALNNYIKNSYRNQIQNSQNKHQAIQLTTYQAETPNKYVMQK